MFAMREKKKRKEKRIKDWILARVMVVVKSTFTFFAFRYRVVSGFPWIIIRGNKRFVQIAKSSQTAPVNCQIVEWKSNWPLIKISLGLIVRHNSASERCLVWHSMLSHVKHHEIQKLSMSAINIKISHTHEQMNIGFN